MNSKRKNLFKPDKVINKLRHHSATPLEKESATIVVRRVTTEATIAESIFREMDGNIQVWMSDAS